MGREQPPLHVVAQDVPDQDVRLLDARGLARRHGDHHVSVRAQRLAVLASERDQLDAELAAQLRSGDDIL